ELPHRAPVHSGRGRSRVRERPIDSALGVADQTVRADLGRVRDFTQTPTRARADTSDQSEVGPVTAATVDGPRMRPARAGASRKVTPWIGREGCAHPAPLGWGAGRSRRTRKC